MEPATLALSGVIFIAVAAMRFLARDPYARALGRICTRLGLHPASPHADEVLSADVDVFEGERGGCTVRLCWSLWLKAASPDGGALARMRRPAAAVAPPPPPPRVCLMLEGLPPSLCLLAVAHGHVDGLGARLRGVTPHDLKTGDAPFDRALCLRAGSPYALGALRATTRAALRAAVEAAGAGVLIWRGRLYGFAPLPLATAESAARLLDALGAVADDLRFDAPPDDPVEAVCALLASEPSHRVRTQCAALLQRAEAPCAREALRAALSDPHPSVRLEAAQGLGDVPTLQGVAWDVSAHDRVRVEALRAVAALGLASLTWDAARGVLRSSEGEALALALALLGEQVPPLEPLPDLLRALLDRLGPASPPAASAITALHRALTAAPDLTASAQPLLIAWLHDDDPHIQRACAEALGDLGDLDALAALTAFTHAGHPAPATRRVALSAADRVRARFPDSARAGALALVTPAQGAGDLSLVAPNDRHAPRRRPR